MWVCGEHLYVQYVYFSEQCMYFKSLILCRWFLCLSCEGQTFTSECVCVLNVGVCVHQCQTGVTFTLIVQHDFCDIKMKTKMQHL